MLVMLCLLVRHGSLGAIGLSRTRTIVSLAGREHIGLPKAIVQPTGESSSTQLHKLAERVALPELPTPFTVLGIETSCDDTGVAIVRSDGTVLGEALASHAALHAEWGGVVPGLARDAHAEALAASLQEAELEATERERVARALRHRHARLEGGLNAAAAALRKSEMRMQTTLQAQAEARAGALALVGGARVRPGEFGETVIDGGRSDSAKEDDTELEVEFYV